MPILYKRCKCGTKILYTQRYCDECARKYSYARNKDYDKNIRDETSTKFYNSAQWKKIRKQVLMQEPFCRICGYPAQMVDHIVPISQGGSKTDYSNLQPLCQSCHNKKTANE